MRKFIPHIIKPLGHFTRCLMPGAGYSNRYREQSNGYEEFTQEDTRYLILDSLFFGRFREPSIKYPGFNYKEISNSKGSLVSADGSEEVNYKIPVPQPMLNKTALGFSDYKVISSFKINNTEEILFNNLL